jgi:hypothetical protein
MANNSNLPSRLHQALIVFETELQGRAFAARRAREAYQRGDVAGILDVLAELADQARSSDSLEGVIAALGDLGAAPGDCDPN